MLWIIVICSSLIAPCPFSISQNRALVTEDHLKPGRPDVGIVTTHSNLFVSFPNSHVMRVAFSKPDLKEHTTYERLKV